MLGIEHPYTLFYSKRENTEFKQLVLYIFLYDWITEEISIFDFSRSTKVEPLTHTKYLEGAIETNALFLKTIRPFLEEKSNSAWKKILQLDDLKFLNVKYRNKTIYILFQKGCIKLSLEPLKLISLLESGAVKKIDTDQNK